LDGATGNEVGGGVLVGRTQATPISFSVDGNQVVAVAAGRTLFVFGLQPEEHGPAEAEIRDRLRG
jgi:hypothetical protein